MFPSTLFRCTPWLKASLFQRPMFQCNLMKYKYHIQGWHAGCILKYAGVIKVLHCLLKNWNDSRPAETIFTTFASIQKWIANKLRGQTPAFNINQAFSCGQSRWWKQATSFCLLIMVVTLALAHNNNPMSAVHSTPALWGPPDSYANEVLKMMANLHLAFLALNSKCKNLHHHPAFYSCVGFSDANHKYSTNTRISIWCTMTRTLNINYSAWNYPLGFWLAVVYI